MAWRKRWGYHHSAESARLFGSMCGRVLSVSQTRLQMRSSEKFPRWVCRRPRKPSMRLLKRLRPGAKQRPKYSPDHWYWMFIDMTCGPIVSPWPTHEILRAHAKTCWRPCEDYCASICGIYLTGIYWRMNRHLRMVKPLLKRRWYHVWQLFKANLTSFSGRNSL